MLLTGLVDFYLNGVGCVDIFFGNMSPEQEEELCTQMLRTGTPRIPKKQAMRRRLLLALTGLAFGLVAPAFAQQKDTAGPPTVQQRDLIGIADALANFDELNHKLEAAYDRNDAAAVAALFTEDAVLMAADGVFSGRQQIEKRYADAFKGAPITEFICSRERFHLKGIDNAVWSTGEWGSTFQGQTGPGFARGQWSAVYVPEGDAWKILLLNFTEYQPLPPDTGRSNP
jgi:uncharacterized protein (TIGR02246 family)